MFYPINRTGSLKTHEGNDFGENNCHDVSLSYISKTFSAEHRKWKGKFFYYFFFYFGAGMGTK